MQFIATINIPGYPPEGDTPVFDTPGAAWQWLAEDRRNAEDMVSEGGLLEEYSDTVQSLDAHASATWSDPVMGVGTVHGSNPAYPGLHDPGLNYTVTVADGQTGN